MEVNKSYIDLRKKGSKAFMKSIANMIDLCDEDEDTATFVAQVVRKIGKMYMMSGVWIDGKNIYEYRGNKWVSKAALLSELRCLCLSLASHTDVKDFMKSSTPKMIQDYMILEQTLTEEKLCNHEIWCYPNGCLIDTDFLPWSETIIPPFDANNSMMGVDYCQCCPTNQTVSKSIAYIFWQMHTVCIRRDTNIVYVIGDYATSFLAKMKTIYGSYIPSRVQIVKELPKNPSDNIIYMVDCSIMMPAIDHTCMIVNCRSEIEITPTELWSCILLAKEVEQPVSVQSVYETIRFDNNSVERYVATCMQHVPEDQRNEDDISVDKSNTCILYKEQEIILYYNAFCRKYGFKKLQSMYLLSHIAACGFPISGPIGNREIEAYIV